MTRKPAPPSIAIHRNPVNPRDCEVHECEAGERLIDWLFSHYPAGFGRPIELLLNGNPLEIEGADVKLAAGDEVAILVPPGGQAIGALIVKALISAAIAAVASIAFNLIFKPGRPRSQDTPAPDPIYSISGAQNAARLGEPVPVLYGEMTTVPDYASQPYAFFLNNDQYLDQLLVIGQGEYDVADVMVGETPVSALGSGAVQYWVFGPADHAQTMGTIEAATGIMENVVSSPEVADQEFSQQSGSIVAQVPEPGAIFTAPDMITGLAGLLGYGWLGVGGSASNNRNFTVEAFGAGSIQTVEKTVVTEAANGNVVLSYYDSPAALNVGPFVTCKPGRVGDRIMADIVFPQGLYSIDDESGDLLLLGVSFSIDYQPINDAGAAIGPWVEYPVFLNRASNTAVRLSYTIDVPAGRYQVRVRRTAPGPANAREVNTFVWTGLHFRLVATPTPVYGPVTLLAVRIKATNGIAGEASSRIRARVTRKLPRLGSGPPLPSTSPADAFADVYCNSVYGAKRPLSELDLAELARIESSWGGQAHFHGGFAQRSTVWEALNIVLQTANAAPLPLGQLMSLAQEGVKANRRQLFTDANMVRETLAIGYTFDKPGDYDGIRVEYRDPANWNSLYATYPPGALDVDQVTLFGCSDGETAAQFARLLWNKRLGLRKTASFETELEGLLARMGDRIAVSADLPRWGMSGVVVGVQGQTLWLDKAPDWAGSGHKLILRDEAGKPSGLLDVTPGDEPNTVQLAAPAPFALFGTGTQEPTHYAFGDSVQLVRDFTVQNIEHRDGARVAVEALAYDPDVFAGTLPWLMEPT